MSNNPTNDDDFMAAFEVPPSSVEDLEQPPIHDDSSEDDGQRNETAKDGPEQAAEGTPLPPMNLDMIEQETEEGPPPWFGMRWTLIPPELKQEAWISLRNWVDQAITEYHLVRDVSPCWHLHPDVVNELYAAMCAEYRVWEEGAPGVGPLTSFQAYIPGIKQRLQESSAQHCIGDLKRLAEEGCHWEAPKPLRYETNRWAATRDAIETKIEIQRPESSSWKVRAAAGDEETTYSEGVTVLKQAVVNPQPPKVAIFARSIDEEITLSATHNREDELSWQYTTGDNQWQDIAQEND